MKKITKANGNFSKPQKMPTFFTLYLLLEEYDGWNSYLKYFKALKICESLLKFRCCKKLEGGS